MINPIKFLILFGKKKAELAPNEETFDNPPIVSSFALDQNIHSTITTEQAETFNNPPAVSSFTLTQIAS